MAKQSDKMEFLWFAKQWLNKYINQDSNCTNNNSLKQDSNSAHSNSLITRLNKILMVRTAIA